MKKSHFVLFLLLSVIGSACEEKEGCILEEEIGRENLPGAWLLIETGHSPGYGYITEVVPAKPAQTVTFNEGGNLSTTNLFEEFSYYHVSTDTVYGGEIIAFYKSNDQEAIDPSDPPPTYSLNIKDNRLTLGYRWCDEGCHMTFKPVRRAPEF